MTRTHPHYHFTGHWLPSPFWLGGSFCDVFQTGNHPAAPVEARPSGSARPRSAGEAIHLCAAGRRQGDQQRFLVSPGRHLLRFGKAEKKKKKKKRPKKGKHEIPSRLGRGRPTQTVPCAEMEYVLCFPCLLFCVLMGSISLLDMFLFCFREAYTKGKQTLAVNSELPRGGSMLMCCTSFLVH